MCFIHEGMELSNSFTSPRQLNTKFLSQVGDEFDDLPPVLILVKISDLGFLFICKQIIKKN